MYANLTTQISQKEKGKKVTQSLQSIFSALEKAGPENHRVWK